MNTPGTTARQLAAALLILAPAWAAPAHDGEEERVFLVCLDKYGKHQGRAERCFAGYLETVRKHDRHEWCTAVACNENGRCATRFEFEQYGRCRAETAGK